MHAQINRRDSLVRSAAVADHADPEAPSRAGQPAALLLIDFDNLFPDDVADSELRHVLMRLIASTVRFCPVDATVSVRLYGGWTANGMLSRRGSEIASMVAQADPLPMVLDGDLVRGSVELAQSLRSEPAIVFDDTYRRRNAPPRLRLAKSPPNGCVDSQICPARILARFTRGVGKLCPGDGCSVTAGTAFTVHEQKMVDTLLACDLIQGAADPDVAAIVVVSDDTDFVPPLLTAAMLKTAMIAALGPNGTFGCPIRVLLTSNDVHVLDLEEKNETGRSKG